MTSAQFTSQVQVTLGLKLMRDVILDGGSGPATAQAPSQAELAVIGGSVRFSALAVAPGVRLPYGRLLPFPGSPAGVAGRRFAELPPAAKHAWLAQHLAALKAGRISLAQLP